MARISITFETQYTCDELRELVRATDMRNNQAEAIDPAKVGVIDIVHLFTQGECDFEVADERMTD